MSCKARHVKVEIPVEDFICPRCGVSCLDRDPFIIDYVDEGADDSCGLLHDHDRLHCYACGYETTGKRYSAQYVKKKRLMTCPMCGGTGHVRREK